jgi:hypothetical protein
MATTRLRKAFQYPSDDDITDPAEGVDEEEQEKLISRLTTEDAQKTALYIVRPPLPLPSRTNSASTSKPPFSPPRPVVAPF